MEAFAKSLADVDFVWILLAFILILTVTGFLLRRSRRLKPYTGQLLLLCAFLLVTILFFVLTFSFRVSKMAKGVSARSMPRVWAVLMVIMAFMTFMTMYKGKEDPDMPFGRWKLVICFIAAAVISVALFPYLGYYLCSAAFIFITMFLLEERNKKMLILTPVCWCIFTYLVFSKLLYISLPIGSVFERILR